VGIVAWAAVGVVVVVGGVFLGLAATSQVVLPLLFAVMLGAIGAPLVARLTRLRIPAGLASAMVVIAAVLLVVGVIALVVSAVVSQSSLIVEQIDTAVDDLSEQFGLGEDLLVRIREALESMGGTLGEGTVTAVMGGVNATVALIVGTILALLLMYYVLKDGREIRAWFVGLLPARFQSEADSFVGAAVRSLRAYWTGRSIISAVVSVVVAVACLVLSVPLVPAIAVVNFVGGFIPYFGAFVGGGLATLLAFSSGGIGSALVILAVVLVANLLLENLLEPRVMSGQLQLHPLAVLIATTAGGVIGGIVGLIIAVPATVVTIDLIKRVQRILEETRTPSTLPTLGASDPGARTTPENP
jgi:predicted PurR-regulated permease PerM